MNKVNPRVVFENGSTIEVIKVDGKQKSYCCGILYLSNNIENEICVYEFVEQNGIREYKKI